MIRRQDEDWSFSGSRIARVPCSVTSAPGCLSTTPAWSPRKLACLLNCPEVSIDIHVSARLDLEASAQVVSQTVDGAVGGHVLSSVTLPTGGRAWS